MSSLVPVRDELLAMKGYSAGKQEADTIRLNANEVPDDAGDKRFSTPLNRYPEVQPLRLGRRMADVFGISEQNLLVTRGSSEAIDVIVRTYCRAYRDDVVIMPPTFEMYGFYAAVQGAGLIEVPLEMKNDFRPDFDAVADACTAATRLIIVCTPNNPTGTAAAKDDILALAEQRKGHTIIVVDEAYIEFSDAQSMAEIATKHDNLIVLRTLSKAQGLAGARCGAAIGNREVIGLLGRVLPPYSFPTPVVDAVLEALTEPRMAASKKAIAEIRRERDRVSDALASMPLIEKVWPSQGNFILARFSDPDTARRRICEARILVRDYEGNALLENCVRITIGSRAENDALLRALAGNEA